MIWFTSKAESEAKYWLILSSQPLHALYVHCTSMPVAALKASTAWLGRFVAGNLRPTRRRSGSLRPSRKRGQRQRERQQACDHLFHHNSLSFKTEIYSAGISGAKGFACPFQPSIRHPPDSGLPRRFSASRLFPVCMFIIIFWSSCVKCIKWKSISCAKLCEVKRLTRPQPLFSYALNLQRAAGHQEGRGALRVPAAHGFVYIVVITAVGDTGSPPSPATLQMRVSSG